MNHRIGIMGGTFDPIHNAHLFIAEEARVRIGLDRVIFVPNGIPPHKKPYAVTSAEHRFAMVDLAVRSNPAFSSSRIEIDRPGPSYAVDTLSVLAEENPGADLFFITGYDAVAEIVTWKCHQEVMELCRFVAIARPGVNADDLAQRLPAAYLERIEVLESPNLGISSTDIRERASNGLPIRYLVPDGVLTYIAEHKLYR
jgi:nicotinate-nucleotide adenylyltransferase